MNYCKARMQPRGMGKNNCSIFFARANIIILINEIIIYFKKNFGIYVSANCFFIVVVIHCFFVRRRTYFVYLVSRKEKEELFLKKFPFK